MQLVSPWSRLESGENDETNLKRDRGKNNPHIWLVSSTMTTFIFQGVYIKTSFSFCYEGHKNQNYF